MIIHLAFTGCLLLLTVFNYYAGRRNVLYPAFLFALIWLVVFCLYMVPLIEINNLGVYTLAVLVSGAAAFSAGAAIVGRRRQSPPVVVFRCGNSISKKVIFFCCLGVLPAFLLEVRKLSGEGGLDGFLSSARVAIVDAVTNGGAPFGPIYTTAVTLAMFSAFIFLIEASDWRRERAWVFASILVALAFALLTTGRSRSLMLVVGLLGISLLNSRRFSARDAWRFVRWPLLALLVLLAVLVPIDKDVSGLNGGTTEVLKTYIFGYTVNPLAGFDYVLHHPSEYEHEPNHTFRDVLPALARFSGSRYTPPPPFDDSVMIPFYTNVYTVFKFYYVDFGLAGMLVAMFVIGAGQTWLFRKALTGDHFYIFLFAISLYPLIAIAFDDMYTAFLGYLKHLSFALLYFRVLRTIPLGARAGFHQATKGDVHISPRFTGERSV